MIGRNRRLVLLALSMLVTVSLSCSLPRFLPPDIRWYLGERPEDDDFVQGTDDDEPSELTADPSPDGGQAEAGDRWDVEQCNAIDDVAVSIGGLSEETFFYDDGSEGGTECTYLTIVENTGADPVSVIYYKHWDYGPNEPNASNQPGWVRIASVPPGETYQYESFLSAYPNQANYVRMLFTLAVVYDSPACRWIRDGGVHADILEITEEVTAPCTLVSPYGDEDAMPDITQGLVQD